MAHVQYGTIVTELKGKIEGQVFQQGNNAKIIRNKGYRAGAKTARRSSAVARLTSITALWKTLSEVQYNSWVALSSIWPFYNRFGVQYYGSAYQVFVAYNTALISMGYPSILVAGTPQTNEEVNVTVFQVSNGNQLDISINPQTTAEMIMQVYASAPQSPGVNRTNLRYKLIGQMLCFNQTNLSLGSEYVDAWGTMPEGSKIVCKFVTRNLQYPLKFQEFYLSDICEYQ